MSGEASCGIRPDMSRSSVVRGPCIPLDFPCTKWYRLCTDAQRRMYAAGPEEPTYMQFVIFAIDARWSGVEGAYVAGTPGTNGQEGGFRYSLDFQEATVYPNLGAAMAAVGRRQSMTCYPEHRFAFIPVVESRSLKVIQ